MLNINIEQLLILFIILTIGYIVGQINIKGVSLGNAGVLFVAILFGYFGFKIQKELMDLGLVLFVYAVGLSVGPGFLKIFQKKGLYFTIIGVTATTLAAIITIFLSKMMHIKGIVATGIFTGALTNTPALAGTIDILSRIHPDQVANVSAGYGIAYPFSMIGVVLLIQFLPKILKRNFKNEEKKVEEEELKNIHKLYVKQFIVNNPDMFGKTIKEINPNRIYLVNISRIKRDKEIMVATPDFILMKHDILMIVGPLTELEKIKKLIGEETFESMDLNREIKSIDIQVTEKEYLGKKFKELNFFEKYGIVVTRVRRNDIEIIPTGNVSLELRDTLRVVGLSENVNTLAKLLQGNIKKLEETNMLPFLIGLTIGLFIGIIPIKLNNGIQIKLGLAGGAFIISILMGYCGKIGKMHIYVPNSVRNFSREFGLIVFLAGTGTIAGSNIIKILGQNGFMLFLLGAIITTITIIFSLLLMILVFKMDLPSILGALSAVMTNPPALSVANERSETNQVNLSYASLYPIALISKIIIAQILLLILL